MDSDLWFLCVKKSFSNKFMCFPHENMAAADAFYKTVFAHDQCVESQLISINKYWPATIRSQVLHRKLTSTIKVHIIDPETISTKKD
jgi:hypothetical protein